MVVVLLFAFFSFLYADDPEDLPDFTSPFSLRSVMLGDALAPDPDNPNWNLKEIALTPQMRKGDPFDKFNLGAVQFVNTNKPDMCLGIEESGFFGLKSCEEDLRSQKFQTLFTIIPTAIDAVQIRSFVLNKDECIAAFLNPRLPSGVGIGIKNCVVDKFSNVPVSHLILITPELREAKTINP